MPPTLRPVLIPLAAALLVAPATGQPAETPRVPRLAQPSYAQFNVPLPMIQRSVLANAAGRLGHMAVDPVSNTLYVAATSAGTLESLEVAGSRQRAAITVDSPQDVLLLGSTRRLAVSSGDGTVSLFAVDDAGNLERERTVSFSGEADALAFDEASGVVHLVHGRNLGSFDPETGETGTSVTVKGSGLLEGLVLEPGGPRAFSNLPGSGEVVVLDRSKGEIAARWKLPGGVKGNAALALDQERGRLFVVARKPAKLVVLDTGSGEAVAVLDAPEDADDAWYDPVLKKIYVSGGGGAGGVAIYSQTLDADGKETYALGHEEATNAGARTSVLVPEQRRLVVAAPAIGTDPAFLYIYLIGP